MAYISVLDQIDRLRVKYGDSIIGHVVAFVTSDAIDCFAKLDEDNHLFITKDSKYRLILEERPNKRSLI